MWWSKAPACLHQWKVIAAQYVPNNIDSASGFLSDALVRRMAFGGSTTITQQCTLCSLLKFEEVAGKPKLPSLRWPGE